MKASQESKNVCVDGWRLEPETDWDREVKAEQGVLKSPALEHVT